jgi:kanamycin kinase
MIPLPPHIAAAHEGWRTEVAYSYAGTTWSLGSPDGRTRFVKVLPAGRYPSLRDERDRMVWARRYLPVPSVVDYGNDGALEWLITDALGGIDATKLVDDPPAVVRTFGEGLRALHEALPPDDCPFDFRLDAALQHCRSRVESGLELDDDLHDEFKHFTPSTAIDWLDANRPAAEDLVVCHGDYCFPNVLIEDGRVTGYIDLGELGVADRWWDIVVGTWTCEWNVGPGFDDLFLESYGIERDDERITFYRLMYDLAS